MCLSTKKQFESCSFYIMRLLTRKQFKSCGGNASCVCQKGSSLKAVVSIPHDVTVINKEAEQSLHYPCMI